MGSKRSRHRHKNLSEKPGTKLERTSQKDAIRTSSRGAAFWITLWSAVLAMLGILLWLPFYTARIDIDISASSNPGDPQPNFFSITNRGVLPIYQVGAIFYAIKLIGSNPRLQMSDNSFGPIHVANVLMANGLPLDIVIPFMRANVTIESNDLELLISYTPKFLFWKRSYACGRFAVEKDANGQPRWLRRQPHDCQELWICLEKKDRGCGSIAKNK